MEFIPAQPRHLEEICVIMEQARAQLRRLGLDQWQKGYPSREVWEQDIRDRAAWLAAEGEQVLGAFMFQTAPEEAYDVIDGSWLTGGPYASIGAHRHPSGEPAHAPGAGEGRLCTLRHHPPCKGRREGRPAPGLRAGAVTPGPREKL